MAIFDKKKLQKIKEMEKKDKKHTIMIVDDEEGNLNSLGSLLSEFYNVITARDSLEALDIIKRMTHSEEISLIISDQRMPNLTGIELFEHLIPIIPNTIRIILTGYEDKNVMLDSINKVKIYEFIMKPFDPDDFLLRIRNAILAFERQQELDQHRRNLEQMVKERTQELEKKNKELEKLNKKLEELNLTDDLTGLWNLRNLERFIDVDIAKVNNDLENYTPEQRKPESQENNINFMILDVDRFRKLHNIHGNTGMESILRQLSKILLKVCSKSDILVRQGWDNFLIVNRFTPRAQAPLLAERLRKAIEEYGFDLGDGKIEQLTCSIGFASYPFLPTNCEEINWEKVVNIAHNSLYAAKKSGRNAWVGLLSTDKTKPTKLYEGMTRDIGKLIANGELKVLTSIPNKKTLVWMK